MADRKQHRPLLSLSVLEPTGLGPELIAVLLSRSVAEGSVLRGGGYYVEWFVQLS